MSDGGFSSVHHFSIQLFSRPSFFYFDNTLLDTLTVEMCHPHCQIVFVTEYLSVFLSWSHDDVPLGFSPFASV